MTKGRIIETLLKTAIIGLISGIVGGCWLYLSIKLNAQAYAQTLPPMQRASHLCAAGSAAVLLGVFSVPAMTLLGLCLGGIFLARKRAAERRPLP